MAHLGPIAELLHLGNQCIDFHFAAETFGSSPGRSEVALPHQVPGGATQYSARAFPARPARQRRNPPAVKLPSWGPSENAAHAFTGIGELLFKPTIECQIEQRLGPVVGSNLEQWIDAGLDRVFTQKIRAKRMDSSDTRFFKLAQRIEQKPSCC